MLIKRFVYYIAIVVIIATSVFNNSLIASAEYAEGETINLYQLLYPIELNDEIIIGEGSFVYGKEYSDDSHIGIIYNDKEYLFESGNFQLVPEKNIDIIPDYIDLSLEEDVIEEEVTIHSNIYSNNSNISDNKITIKETHISNLLIEDGQKFIVIGNIAYKIVNNEAIYDNSEDENLNSENGTKVKVNKDIEISSNSDVNENNSIQKKSYNLQIQTNSLDSWGNSNAKYFKVLDLAIPVYESINGSLVKVGEVKKDQIFPRIGVLNNWHIIQFGNIKGYVWSESTEPANENDVPNLIENNTSTNRYFTTKQHVVVYDNSSGSMVAMGAISEGERYPVVSNAGNWIQINFGNRTGFVYKDWVKFDFTNSDRYFKVLDLAIPIYESINGSLVKVGEVKKNQVYPRIGVKDNWHIIEYGNKHGYVWSQSTEPANNNSISNLNKTYTNSERHILTKQHVVVYDNSSGSMVAMGAIVEGERYPIVSLEGNWVKILFGNRVGYIYKDWVKVEFVASDVAFLAEEEHIPVYFNNTGELVKAGHLIKGQKYIISGRKGNWHKIDYGSNYGYVWMDSTSPTTTNSIRNLNTNLKDSYTSVVALNGLVVYDNSSGLEPFARIDEGTIIPLVSDRKFGNWYQIIIAGRIGYIHVDGVTAQSTKYTQYNLSLEQALQMQLRVNPTTTNEYKTYVSKDWIDANKKVTADVLNVRGGPGDNYWIVGQLKKGYTVTILGQVGNWYEIEYTKYWQDVGASPTDTRYYLDPNNFVNDEIQRFQFLDLSKSSNVSAGVLNAFLKGKGTLDGQAQAFIDASRIHGINDVYLVSHAILETGHGTSNLAKGIQVGKNSSGTPVLVTNSNRNSLKEIKTVYNMFGIHAFNHAPDTEGAKKAYIEGWDTPYKAIVGGAAFIGNNYIKAGQNTLYKMRWNPDFMSSNNYASHQYATDIGWAYKQVYSIYNLYNQIGNYVLYLDIPKYK